MLVLCPNRDRLWNEYYKGMAEYIAAVQRFSAKDSRGIGDDIAIARAFASERRDMIREHCEQHGCDPEFLRYSQSVRDGVRVKAAQAKGASSGS